MSFKKISFTNKSVDILKIKECKRNVIKKFFFSRKFEKWKIYLGPLVLAVLKCYFGDNGHKMQTTFKTLVSKNAAKWRLYKHLGNAKFV